MEIDKCSHSDSQLIVQDRDNHFSVWALRYCRGTMFMFTMILMNSKKLRKKNNKNEMDLTFDKPKPLSWQLEYRLMTDSESKK